MVGNLGQQLIRQNLSFFFVKVREETNVCQTEGVMRSLSVRKIYNSGENIGKFPLVHGNSDYVSVILVFTGSQSDWGPITKFHCSLASEVPNVTRVPLYGGVNCMVIQAVALAQNSEVLRSDSQLLQQIMGSAVILKYMVVVVVIVVVGGLLGEINKLMLIIQHFSQLRTLGVKNMKQGTEEMRWAWPCRVL